MTDAVGMEEMIVNLVGVYFGDEYPEPQRITEAHKILAELVKTRRKAGAPKLGQPAEAYEADYKASGHDFEEIVDGLPCTVSERKFLLVTWPAWQKRSYELSLYE